MIIMSKLVQIASGICCSYCGHDRGIEYFCKNCGAAMENIVDKKHNIFANGRDLIRDVKKLVRFFEANYEGADVTKLDKQFLLDLTAFCGIVGSVKYFEIVANYAWQYLCLEVLKK